MSKAFVLAALGVAGLFNPAARAGSILVGDYNGPAEPSASPSNPIPLTIGTFYGLPDPSTLTAVTLSGYFGNSQSNNGTADVQVYISNANTGVSLLARYIAGYYSGPPLYWYYNFAAGQFASYFDGGQFTLSVVQTSPINVRLGSLTLAYSTLPGAPPGTGGGGAGGTMGGPGVGGAVPEAASWVAAVLGAGTLGLAELRRAGRRRTRS